MEKTAIIVAGGSGIRMESDVPKQFALLANRPVIMHSIQAFYDYDNSIKIIVVFPENEFGRWNKLCNQYKFKIKHDIVAGGKTRFNSVKNGLKKAELSGLVAIHDGARPLVKTDLIARCFESAKKYGNGVPVIKPADSMRIVEKGKNKSINRKLLRIVQTPQVFSTEIINKAFDQKYSENFTDEANVAECIGEKIYLVEGDIENIKITLVKDLFYAEVLLK